MALAAYTDRAVAQSAKELSQPTSTVEVGVGDVSQGSYKAGEYNGLEHTGALVSPTAAQTALVDAAANADAPLFHNVNLFTKRTKYDAGFNVNFAERWGLDANVR